MNVPAAYWQFVNLYPMKVFSNYYSRTLYHIYIIANIKYW